MKLKLFIAALLIFFAGYCVAQYFEPEIPQEVEALPKDIIRLTTPEGKVIEDVQEIYVILEAKNKEIETERQKLACEKVDGFFFHMDGRYPGDFCNTSKGTYTWSDGEFRKEDTL